MKKKSNLLVSSILGMIVGWALGFLRIPFIEKNHSFWLGFLSCLAFVLLIRVLWNAWKTNAALKNKLNGLPDTSESATIRNSYASITSIFTPFIVMGAIIISLLLYNQKGLFQTQTQHLNKEIYQQTDLIEAIRNNNLALLMSILRDKMEEELENNPDRSISDATIARIAELSQSFKPYQTKEDSLLINMLSPERGRLLQELAEMRLDTGSFNKIKRNVTFAGADLSKTNLDSIDLSQANLSHANLWGASLQQANLAGADLTGADLRWADFSNADLTAANLNGVDLTNAKLIKTNLSKATLQWAELDGAMLNETNLTESDLVGAVLLNTNFHRTNFTDANLHNANIEADWFEMLEKRQIIDAEVIKDSYEFKIDVANAKRQRLNRIKKPEGE